MREDLQCAEDIFNEFGKPLLHRMAIFEAVLIDNKPRTFQKTVKMSSEGVYSTYFIFAPVSVTKDKEALKKYFDTFFDDGKRLLRASNQVDIDKSNLEITGSISYINSYGYLNADEYPMMQLYLIAFAFYLGATCLWVYKMR